jgi:chloramphenicol 3-O phosphotransferase
LVDSRFGSPDILTKRNIGEHQVPGQIIIVNGTSGSGKSTTCELFAKRSDDFWLLYGIDHFLGATYPGKFGHHGARCAEGIYAHPLDDSDPDGPLRWSLGERGISAFGAFHEWIASASREGCNIVLDHLLMMDPPLLQDCVSRLQDLPVLFVTLKPPYDVLVERINKREIGNRFANSEYSSQQAQKSKQRLDRLRPWFYEVTYANDCCDLEIDTVKHQPADVCDLIEQRLAQGPGTAFEQLARRFQGPTA